MTEPAAVVRCSEGVFRRVAGLSLLERAVLALRRAGVSSVALLVDPSARARLERHLERSRVGALPLVRLEAHDAEQAAAVAAWRGQRPLLVFEQPVAVDAGFIEALQAAVQEQQSPPVTAVGSAVRWLPTGAPFGAAPARQLEPAALGGTAEPVASAADGRRARRALLAQSIKPLEIDGVICWLLVRRISVRLSAVLLGLPVTPNQITLLSILVGLAAAVGVAVGAGPWPVLGASLLMVSLILDNCDGELARVKYQGSTFGAWLDIYGDFVVNAAFMAGMAVGAFRRFDQPVYLWAGAFAVFAFTFYNAAVFRYIHRLGIPDEFLFKWWFDQEAEAAAARAARRGDAPPPASDEGPGPLGRLLSGLKYLGRRDFFIFAYLVTAALGVLHWAFWATVAGAALNFVMMGYQLLLWKGVSRGDGTHE
jgi:phosphatidylglycerophosphate synthase